VCLPVVVPSFRMAAAADVAATTHETVLLRAFREALEEPDRPPRRRLSSSLMAWAAIGQAYYKRPATGRRILTYLNTHLRREEGRAAAEEEGVNNDWETVVVYLAHTGFCGLASALLRAGGQAGTPMEWALRSATCLQQAVDLNDPGRLHEAEECLPHCEGVMEADEIMAATAPDGFSAAHCALSLPDGGIMWGLLHGPFHAAVISALEGRDGHYVKWYEMPDNMDGWQASYMPQEVRERASVVLQTILSNLREQGVQIETPELLQTSTSDSAQRVGRAMQAPGTTSTDPGRHVNNDVSVVPSEKEVDETQKVQRRIIWNRRLFGMELAAVVAALPAADKTLLLSPGQEEAPLLPQPAGMDPSDNDDAWDIIELPASPPPHRGPTAPAPPGDGVRSTQREEALSGKEEAEDELVDDWALPSIDVMLTEVVLNGRVLGLVSYLDR
jgi:hypothetical protein